MDASPRLHPSDESLIGFGLGKLDDASGVTVSRHLEQCDACRRRVASLSADSFLGRLRDAKGPADAPSFRSLVAGTGDGPAGQSAPPPAEESLPPGLADHPDYQVVRELGRGGMGVVYLARNRLMGRDEVLKVMGRQLVGRAGVPDRFVREIQAVARLRHPNIVAAYHAFRLGESIVFAMEHVDGYDLARLVKSRGPLPVAHAAFFAHQVAQGLQHAHEEGMVHRDIKPHNLMLTRKGDRGTIKILDFGLAKATREAPIDGGLTHANQMLGSPDYIAPEQSLDAQKADIRADLYSLGCTLYFLLTGGPPFRGTSLYDILQAHHSIDAKPLNFIRPEVPAELAALVTQLMAKDPARRPQTPAEAARALTPFFKKTGAAINPPTVKAPTDERISTKSSESKTESTSTPIPAPKPIAPHPSSKPTRSTPAEPNWKSLIDIETPALHPSPSVFIIREQSGLRIPKIRRLWPMLAAIALALLVFSVAVVRVMTRDGIVILEGLPRDADVFVDDSKVQVAWPPGKSAEIMVSPGKRGLKVQLGHDQLFGEQVSILPGGETRLTIKWQPSAHIAESNRKADLVGPLDPPKTPGEVGPARSTAPSDGARPVGVVRVANPELTQFKPLFNGIDLNNWEEKFNGKPMWAEVHEGYIVTMSNGRLCSTRDDFDNFHLRLHLKAEANCFGNIYVRLNNHQQSEATYAVAINTLHDQSETPSTGSINVSYLNIPLNSKDRLSALAVSSRPPAIRDKWFHLDIIAIESKFAVLINGKIFTKTNDPKRTHTRGRIAIHRGGKAEGGELLIRRVGVKEFGRDGVNEIREAGFDDYVSSIENASGQIMKNPTDDTAYDEAEARYASTIPFYSNSSRNVTDRSIDVKCGYNDDRRGDAYFCKGIGHEGDPATLTKKHISGKTLYNAYGRDNAIVTHPFNPTDRPAIVDFSRLTRDKTGTLALRFHAFRNAFSNDRGSRIIIKIDGEVFKDVLAESKSGWVQIDIPLRHTNVSYEHHALGWYCEFLFMDYHISNTKEQANNMIERTELDSKSFEPGSSWQGIRPC